MASEQIQLEIVAKFNEALADLKRFSSEAEKSFGKIEKSTSTANLTFSSFIGNIASNVATAAFNALTSAASNLFQTFVVDGVHAAIEQEDAINQLNNSLKAAGQFSEEASKDFIEFAESLQKTTRFSDDAIEKNAALLESIAGLTEEGLKEATQAAVDFAATGLVSLEDAFVKIGKAAEGEVGSFKKLGIEIKKGNSDAETFQNTLAKLNSQFAGRAASDVNTFGGSIAQLKNNFNELVEAVGFAIINNDLLNSVIKSLGKGIVELSEHFGGNLTAQEKLRIKLRELIADQAEAQESLSKLNKDFNPGEVQAYTSAVANYQVQIDDTSKALKQLNAEESKAQETKARSKSLTEQQISLQKEALKLVEDQRKIARTGDDEATKAEQDLALLKEAFAQKLITEQEFEAARGQLQTDANLAAAERLIAKNELLAQIDGVKHADEIAANKAKANSLLGNSESLSQKELSIKAKQVEKERALRKKGLDDAQSFFGDLLTLSQGSNRSLFEVAKAASLATAIVRGYEAVQVAYATGGPFPYNFISAAATAIKTAVQIKGISASQFAFGTDSVPGVGTRDSVPALLTPGERVVPRNTNRDLTQFLSGSNETNGLLQQIAARLDRLENNVTVNIGSKEIIEVVNTGIREGRVLAS